MPSFKKPDLPVGPLKDLIEALHTLHLAAGYPSTRSLEDDLGGAEVSHTTIHNVFTSGRLPRWGIVDVLTTAMARRADRDERAEVDRMRNLWTVAAKSQESAGSPVKIPEIEIRTENEHIDLPPSVAQTMPGALIELEAFPNKEEIGKYRVSTGFDDLDAVTGGWSIGSLVVIGGRPSSGKTVLMLTFSSTASYVNGFTSMIASSEETSGELNMRMLSSMSRVPSLYLRTGQLSKDDWNNLARSMINLSDAPVFFSSSSHLTLDEILEEARKLAERLELRILFIDGFLSFVDRNTRDYTSKVEPALRRLKSFAQLFSVTIIVNIPTKRPEKWGFGKDTHLLPEGEAIERVADVVIILDRPDQDDRETPRAGEADLHVVKNRYGPEQTVLAAFQGHYARFVDISANAYPIFPREEREVGKSATEDPALNSGDSAQELSWRRERPTGGSIQPISAALISSLG